MAIFNSEAQNKANNALSKFLKTPSQEKRKRFQKRMDYYNGIQEEYLKEDLKRVFKDPSRLKLQLEYDNITKFLIDEVATVYDEPPIRKITNGTDQDEEIIQSIWEGSSFDLLMQEVNRLTKLHKTLFVKVVWRNESIQYDILTPNLFDVIEMPEDQTKAKSVVYVQIVDSQKDTEYINNDKTRLSEDRFESTDAIFHYWDNESYIAFKRGSTRFAPAKLEDNPNNKNNENPYGIIPMVVCRDRYPSGAFFIEGGDDLIDRNSIINQKLTEKNFLTKMQAFSVPVRKGAKNNDPIIMDPSLTIDIPGDDDISRGNDFKFVTPDPAIQELARDIEMKIRAIALEYKLNPDIFTASALRSSSHSLQLQNAQKSKIIKADKPFYMDIERDLFNMTKVVYNKHNSKQISENAELQIDYRESETVMTIEERDNHNIVLETNGMISKVDWLMDINPDIRDRKEAMERLKEIAEESKEINAVATENNPLQGMINGGPEQEPTEQDQEINQ